MESLFKFYSDSRLLRKSQFWHCKIILGQFSLLIYTRDRWDQWRSQGGGALGNCPVLENLLPKDFWRWWLLPSIENFDRYVVFKNSVGFSKNSVEFSKNSVEFSKKFYGLTANYRTECRLVSDEIFLYFFSTLQWKLMYFTDNQL